MNYVHLGALRCGASLRCHNLQQLYVLCKHIAKKKQNCYIAHFYSKCEVNIGLDFPRNENGQAELKSEQGNII